ncbi:hypothetical protein Murru_1227 [Allomuricauda ruestringensis DSM 13258]|uniref:Uncharacterized protein n=1 Tax=Allomuricauda ruestringensis (strain DSM 13258 / CIP 107369 / LMG 19739 / B1) TaxID=886377 RepID=G2PNT5_ALLRU|nr:hypothetical protein Murru_1227 [Allomuricauda ruestringensis DSM 13258]
MFSINLNNIRHLVPIVIGIVSGSHQKRFGCEMLNQVQHDDFEQVQN